MGDTRRAVEPMSASRTRLALDAAPSPEWAAIAVTRALGGTLRRVEGGHVVQMQCGRQLRVTRDEEGWRVNAVRVIHDFGDAAASACAAHPSAAAAIVAELCADGSFWRRVMASPSASLRTRVARAIRDGGAIAEADAAAVWACALGDGAGGEPPEAVLRELELCEGQVLLQPASHPALDVAGQRARVVARGPVLALCISWTPAGMMFEWCGQASVGVAHM